MPRPGSPPGLDRGRKHDVSMVIQSEGGEFPSTPAFEGLRFHRFVADPEGTLLELRGAAGVSLTLRGEVAAEVYHELFGGG